MTPEELIDYCPELYHVTGGACCSIRKHGLLTTNDLLGRGDAEFSLPVRGWCGDLGNSQDWRGMEEHEDPGTGCKTRGRCVRVRDPDSCLDAVIRDQVPLNEKTLISQLAHQRLPRPGIPTLEEWHRRQNDRVFFFPTREKAEELAEKYRKKGAPQKILVICTKLLVEAHGDRIELSAYNSGTTDHQGEDVVSNGWEKWHDELFLPLDDYDYRHWLRKRRRKGRPVREVTVRGGVPDITKYVIKVVEMDGSPGGNELSESRCRPRPPKPPTRSPYRVLSLDGGGMRGVYTATYLKSVAETFARRRGIAALDVGAGFDLIVGNSTGGIIACALARGVPLGEVVNLYREHGPQVFRRPVPTKLSLKTFPEFVDDLFMRRDALARGDQALREALEGILGKTTLAEMYEKRRIALAIPAVEMSRHRGWVFKTPHFKDTTGRDDGCTLVDVCMATSAAPVYRSMARITSPDDQQPPGMFVDGGLWANNPVMIGLLEALEVAPPDQPIEIFCLGACQAPAGEDIAHADPHRDLRGWSLGSDIALLMITAQQTAYDHMAMKLASFVTQSTGRECRVMRFPAEIPPGTFRQHQRLDDTRTEAVDALTRQAQADANETNSRLSRKQPDSEEQAIWNLFDSMPGLTDPPQRRSSKPSCESTIHK